MRIAICDDEHNELLHLQSLIYRYDPGLDVSLYASAEAMLTGITNQQCDIILLDIEMDGMNGFTAAKKLVSIKNPPLIIFVTNSSEYTYHGYEVAYRYLPKPVSYAVLLVLMRASLRNIRFPLST